VVGSFAEAAGFDMFVFEDALLYRGETATDGVWESVVIASAVAATTGRINLGQSVVNSPYRAPAMTAKIAETRRVLGYQLERVHSIILAHIEIRLRF